MNQMQYFYVFLISEVHSSLLVLRRTSSLELLKVSYIV